MFKRTLYLFFGILLAISSGSVSIYPVYLYYIKNLYGYSLRQINLYATFINIGCWIAFGMGIIYDCLGPKCSNFWGYLFLPVCLLILYRLIELYSSVSLFWLLFLAFIMGQGSALLYTSALSTNLKNFSKRNASNIVGLIISNCAISPSIFASFKQAFDTMDIPDFLIFVFIYISIFIILSFCMFDVVKDNKNYDFNEKIFRENKQAFIIGLFSSVNFFGILIFIIVLIINNIFGILLPAFMIFPVVHVVLLVFVIMEKCKEFDGFLETRFNRAHTTFIQNNNFPNFENVRDVPIVEKKDNDLEKNINNNIEKNDNINNNNNNSNNNNNENKSDRHFSENVNYSKIRNSLDFDVDDKEKNNKKENSEDIYMSTNIFKNDFKDENNNNENNNRESQQNNSINNIGEYNNKEGGRFSNISNDKNNENNNMNNNSIENGNKNDIDNNNKGNDTNNENGKEEFNNESSNLSEDDDNNNDNKNQDNKNDKSNGENKGNENNENNEISNFDNNDNGDNTFNDNLNDDNDENNEKNEENNKENNKENKEQINNNKDNENENEQQTNNNNRISYPSFFNDNDNNDNNENNNNNQEMNNNFDNNNNNNNNNYYPKFTLNSENNEMNNNGNEENNNIQNEYPKFSITKNNNDNENNNEQNNNIDNNNNISNLNINKNNDNNINNKEIENNQNKNNNRISNKKNNFGDSSKLEFLDSEKKNIFSPDNYNNTQNNLTNTYLRPFNLNNIDDNEKEEEENHNKCVLLLSLLCKPQIMKLFIVLVLTMGSMISNVNNIKFIVASITNHSLDSTSLDKYPLIYFSFNSISRIFTGASISAVMGTDYTFAALQTITFIGLLSQLWGIFMTKFTIYISITLAGITHGSLMTFVPLYCRYYYNVNDLGTVLGFLTTGNAVGSVIIATLIFPHFYHKYSQYDYKNEEYCSGKRCFRMSYLINSLFMFTAFLISYWIFKNDKKKKIKEREERENMYRTVAFCSYNPRVSMNSENSNQAING